MNYIDFHDIKMQDDHEICFVDEEGFRQLSIPDYPSEAILDKYIAKEKTM